MIFYDVLSRKEKELWDLVELLSDKKVISSAKSLCQDLQVTEFVLEQRFNELNASWQTVFNRQLFDLEKDFIEGIYISDNQELLYKQYLLDHSTGNKLLLEILMDRYELDEFVVKNKISQASVYRVLKEVKLALAKWGVTVRKNEVFGSELTIRNLLMSILNYREIDFRAYSDENIIDSTKAIIAVIEDVYGIKLKPSQQNLMLNVSFLAIIRHQKKHYHKKLISVKYSEQDELLAERLIPYAPVLVEHYQDEVDQMLLFLYAFDVLPTITLEESPEVSLMRQFTQEFNRTILDIMALNQLPESRFEVLFEECERLHWRNYLFQNYYSGFNFMKDTDWAGVSDVLFEQIDQLYLKYGLLPENLLKDTDQRMRLCSDYFFVITKFISDDAALPEVKVCVDFSQSAIMYGLTKRLIEVLWFCNIQVQENVDETTQLYISDRHIPWLDLPQIIWTGPPHYREIMMLTRMATQLAGHPLRMDDEEVRLMLSSEND